MRPLPMMLTSCLLATAFGFGSLACSSDSTPEQGLADASPDQEDAAIPMEAAPGDADAATPTPPVVDEQRLLQVVKTLSDPAFKGRLSGSSSGKAAEDFVLQTMQQSGLQVQTQDVPVPVYETSGPLDLAVVDGTGNVVTQLAYFDDYREVEFTGGGDVTEEIVFVGYGIVAPELDSFAGIDVTGKVAAILTGYPATLQDPQTKARINQKIDNAYARGAKAVIFVLATTFAKNDAVDPTQTIVRALASNYDFEPALAHADMPVVFLHLLSTPKVFGKTADALAADPTPYATGIRVHLELHGKVDPNGVCRNVIGLWPPASTEQASILVGAHHDHLGLGADGRIYPGAADNASGVGVVVEAATALGARPDLPTHRTIAFALFCGEESGLRGSKAYVQNPVLPIAQIGMAVIADYVGAPDGPYLTNGDTSALYQAFVKGETNAATLPLVEYAAGGECASDDCSFLAAKVPAYRFLTVGPHHHLPSDTYENLDKAMVTRVASITVDGLVRAIGVQ